jgi:NAD(P)-dependent dehydrogenase (short-subunit alcohol dehydrogenase family)
MIALNVAATFYACRAAWPLMQQQGGGTIINISSVAAVDPFPGFAAYGASKRFVEGLTAALAKEGTPHNIRLFAIAPGAVETQMLRSAFPDFPEDQCLPPQAIADLALALLNPACHHASGQTIQCKK